MKVVFAPHCDDAYLSLGGSILEWRQKGEQVLIINCFSKSGFTLKVSSTESDLVSLISHTRSMEEIINAMSVGAEVEFLELPEAQLRGYRKPWTVEKSQKGPFGLFRKSDDDSQVEEPLTRAILKYVSDNETFFPLGNGNHIDHVFVNNIAQKIIQEKGISLHSFYEDLPYSSLHLIDEERITAKGLRPILKSIDWEKKKVLLQRYKSQLGGKYGLKIIKSIGSYCSSLGECERIWIPKTR